MNKMYTIIVILLLSLTLPAHSIDNLKAFPPADQDKVRYVLQLPKQDDESAFKVELIVGKTIQIDERNNYFFGGKIEEETIQGWGFPRYIVNKIGPMAGTRMAIDPNVPKVTRFIKLGGDNYLIRYNSRLPIVIYVPEGVEVRYRVWTAGTKTKAIEEG